jgi:hypothetical protein
VIFDGQVPAAQDALRTPDVLALDCNAVDDADRRERQAKLGLLEQQMLQIGSVLREQLLLLGDIFLAGYARPRLEIGDERLEISAMGSSCGSALQRFSFTLDQTRAKWEIADRFPLRP